MMKNFRKNQDNSFICEECGKSYIKKDGLSKHINKFHKGTKYYYDKWLKEDEEGYCNICNKETTFRGLHFGYKQTCENKKCIIDNHQKIVKHTLIQKYGIDSIANVPGVQNKKRETCLKKYGVEVSSQSKKVKETAIKNNLEKYGVINPSKLEEIKEKTLKTNYKKYGVTHHSQLMSEKEKKKQTNLLKYGVEFGLQNSKIREQGYKKMIDLYGDNPLQHIQVKEKKKQTNLLKYGVDSHNKSNIVKEKKKKSCLEKYGVENPMQNSNIFIKNQKSGFRAKIYKTLYYRGSYELDFLEKYYDKIDIENGPSIHYVFDGKNKVYHSDFYIPSLNLVIEIKSSYYYNRFKEQNKIKGISIEEKGYKYIKILDKDYNEFKKLCFNI